MPVVVCRSGWPRTCVMLQSFSASLRCNRPNHFNRQPTPCYRQPAPIYRQPTCNRQMFKLMKELWSDKGHEIPLVPYGCVTLAYEVGILEIVTRTNTLSNITREASGVGKAGASGVWNNKILAEWLRSHNPTDRGYDMAAEKFLRSCAGLCSPPALLPVCLCPLSLLLPALPCRLHSAHMVCKLRSAHSCWRRCWGCPAWRSGSTFHLFLPRPTFCPLGCTLSQATAWRRTC